MVAYSEASLLPWISQGEFSYIGSNTNAEVTNVGVDKRRIV